MQSTIFNSSTPLAANALFPATIIDWDNVLSYGTYNFKIYANTECKVTVYQSTPPDPAASEGNLNFSVATVYVFQNENNIKTVTNPIESRFIAFQVQNKSSNAQTVFDFSVVYK
jgi:hypothetical protein